MEETEVGPVGVTAVSFEDVISKEDIGNLVLFHIGNDVFREIARVDDMHLLEGEEQIAR